MTTEGLRGALTIVGLRYLGRMSVITVPLVDNSIPAYAVAVPVSPRCLTFRVHRDRVGASSCLSQEGCRCWNASCNAAAVPA